MTGINRRRFMQLAGGTAALSAFSSSIARAAEIPANRRTGTLRDVDHIVVLMQENRSFDHYFGALRGVRGFGDPHPVAQPDGTPVWFQRDGSKEFAPFRPDVGDLGLRFLEDLDHSWGGGHDAWNGGAYDRWVPAKTATTMAYYTREDIPFHYALADAFTICDAYHCSVIGPTDPNRYYMWTGYTGNDGAGGGPVLANDELGYSWRTYPERLEQAGISWKIYQDKGDGLDAGGVWGFSGDPYIGNFGDNSLLYFDNYRNAGPGDPLFEKARTGTDAKNGQDMFEILRADVRAGRLPQISWIAAPEAFSEHPNWPVNYGAWYISQILDALTANPEVWAGTALFICYDENDGFFDHAVPPYPTQGRSTVDLSGELFEGSGQFAAGPYGLGQRVPMFVVSPWSTGGWVCSQVFDHTSLIRFMERRFGVREPNISPWRRAICGDLTTAFDFGRTATAVPSLPDTTAFRPPDHDRHPDFVPKPPPHPALPEQEPGLRPARPLPYDLSADARGGLAIDFASQGQAGVTFHVTSRTHPDGPWTFTVEAGRRLSGTWDAADAYDFEAHGPNGFLRRFAGHGPGPEVTARDDGANQSLRVVLTNPGNRIVDLLVEDAYGGSATYRLRPGASAVHTADTRRTHGWYDLTVTADGGFLRRLAGHVETGGPSTSDPAIATRPGR